MKIHRFIGAYQLGRGTMRIDDANLAHQIRSVLKLRVGEMVIVGDGTGLEAHCTILSYDRDAVLLDCTSLERNTVELAGHTTLYCAVLKGDHFETAVAMAAEAGISEIVPLCTARTIKFNLRLDRVTKIVREAAELAGRGLVPQVHEVREFERALTDASAHDVNFFFEPAGKPFTGVAQRVKTAGLFIGPEGGWDPAEVQVAQDAGLRMVSLGGIILRAQTAVPIASYLVAHALK